MGSTVSVLTSSSLFALIFKENISIYIKKNLNCKKSKKSGLDWRVCTTQHTMINAWAVYAVRLSRCREWIWPCRARRIKKDHFGSGHLLDAPVQFRGSVTPISVSRVYTQTQMQGSKQSQSCFFFPPLLSHSSNPSDEEDLSLQSGRFLACWRSSSLGSLFPQIDCICIIRLWQLSVALYYRQPWICFDPAGR